MPKQLKASKVERIVNEITNQRNNIMSSKGEVLFKKCLR